MLLLVVQCLPRRGLSGRRAPKWCRSLCNNDDTWRETLRGEGLQEEAADVLKPNAFTSFQKSIADAEYIVYLDHCIVLFCCSAQNGSCRQNRNLQGVFQAPTVGLVRAWTLLSHVTTSDVYPLRLHRSADLRIAPVHSLLLSSAATRQQLRSKQRARTAAMQGRQYFDLSFS
nr:hypothetical protein CFP56_53747 [Quercus suber]